jgi:8-oxo-dGTP pyrophosphatase MutT (NUDIX family)
MRKSWWQFAKPHLAGVTIVARDSAGRVLLVRHTYDRGAWTLPGGGIRHGEEPAAAARREFAEELRCPVEQLEEAGVHKLILHGARLTRHVFSGRVEDTPEPDGREVAEARFFRPEALPRQCSTVVDKYLAMSE